MIGLTDSPIIETNCGQVRGRTYYFDDTRHSVSAFLGIPYAKPPIGSLRFKKPQPTDSWFQIRNCNSFGGCCPFIEPGRRGVFASNYSIRRLLVFECFCASQSRQCDNKLCIIFKNTVKSNLPVLFYIHGGGYVIGNSAQCGDLRICKYLCSKDLIVVTINYRLGLFGFFTTGDSKAPGNYGLWYFQIALYNLPKQFRDQTLALKWVKDNIERFGGNPTQVTVSGHSAGAASADLLSISPHSRDLFQNVALIGGSSFCNWAMTRTQSTLRKAFKLAQKRGFRSKNSNNEELLNFLQRLPASELKIAAHGIPVIGDEDIIAMHLAPVIDGDFFPKMLDELRKEAPKRNVLAGIAEYEGLIAFVLHIKFLATNRAKDSLEEKAKMFIRTYVKSRNDAERIQQIFNKMTSAEGDYEKQCIQIMSDLFISFGLYESAQSYMQRGGNVFLYTFEHIRPGVSGLLENFLPFLGASHGTEIAYLFGTLSHSDFQPNKHDELVIDRFASYFANFSRTGDPSTRSQPWLPISTNRPFQHMIIQSNSDEQEDNFCDKRPLTWQKLFENNRSKL
ncbi:Carboxylic ester hydrolase [Aphelenchoides bicaudatus]|nr:Carboxylic ester hydrolase [Aphelenchoides bicaudatus]